jgi:hypothetical protein
MRWLYPVFFIPQLFVSGGSATSREAAQQATELLAKLDMQLVNVSAENWTNKKRLSTSEVENIYKGKSFYLY